MHNFFIPKIWFQDSLISCSTSVHNLVLSSNRSRYQLSKSTNCFCWSGYRCLIWYGPMLNAVVWFNWLWPFSLISVNDQKSSSSSIINPQLIVLVTYFRLINVMLRNISRLINKSFYKYKVKKYKSLCLILSREGSWSSEFWREWTPDPKRST